MSRDRQCLAWREPHRHRLPARQSGYGAEPDRRGRGVRRARLRRRPVYRTPGRPAGAGVQLAANSAALAGRRRSGRPFDGRAAQPGQTRRLAAAGAARAPLQRGYSAPGRRPGARLAHGWPARKRRRRERRAVRVRDRRRSRTVWRWRRRSRAARRSATTRSSCCCPTR